MRRNLTVPSHRPVGFADGAAHLPGDWIFEKSLLATLRVDEDKVAAGLNPAAHATLVLR
jgi:hypothetical protein